MRLRPGGLWNPCGLRPRTCGCVCGTRARGVGAKARFWNVQVGIHDVLWLTPGELAGQVVQCVQGRDGCLLLCKRLRLHAWQPFGSVWDLTEEEILLQPDRETNLVLPSWWRFQGPQVLCLH